MEHAEPPESLRVALLDEADGAGIEAAAAVLERGFHQDDGFHRTLGLTGSDMAGYWRRIVTLFCRSDGAFVVLALDGDDVVGVLLATRERFFPRGTATVDYLRATVRAVGWLRAARVMVLGQRFERKAR
ncbi:MAG: hypothetical protein KC502_23485, partial [Myxococcales bacterium]|nr:hypothetical protein [Myxococcales bacterium]